MRDIWKDRLTRKRSNSACPPTHINTQSSATYYYKWKIFEVTTLDQVSEYVPSLRPLESYFIWIISPKFPPPALETISSHPGISSISQSSRDNHRFDSNKMNFLLVPELLGVQLNTVPISWAFLRKPKDPNFEISTRHQVSINASKTTNFSLFYLWIETHEGLLHEKLIFHWFRSL